MIQNRLLYLQKKQKQLSRTLLRSKSYHIWTDLKLNSITFEVFHFQIKRNSLSFKTQLLKFKRKILSLKSTLSMQKLKENLVNKSLKQIEKNENQSFIMNNVDFEKEQ